MAMETAISWEDRRSEVREATALRSRVFYGPDLSAWADCVVRNLSPKGAMLEVSAMYPLPKRFMVMTIADGVAMEVDMKWRRSDMAGVRIIQRTPLDAACTGRLAGLRDIWLGLQKPG